MYGKYRYERISASGSLGIRTTDLSLAWQHLNRYEKHGLR